MNPSRLITFDIASINGGLAYGCPMLFRTADGYRPSSERTNFLIRRADGRVFAYEEGEASERTLEWIGEYSSLIRPCELFLIEKQLARQNYEAERQCLTFEQSLKTALLTLKVHGLWGGVVGVVSPKEWKNWWGIPSSPKHLNIAQKHEFQKAEAIKAYIKRYGEEDYKALVLKWGKVDDVIEAEMFWVFAAENYDSLLKRYKYTSSHEMITQDGGGRITKSEREQFTIGGGLLSDMTGMLLTPMDLGGVWRGYKEFKNSRKRRR